jgi:LysR family transcriptional regulator (chromosome initiation inhibitor)
MLEYAHLSTLAAVHRRGSFEGAAAQLAITPSAVSQRIKALEDRIGSLLIRRGQPCTATEAGMRLIRHLDQVAVMEAALDVGPRDLAVLRVAVNADSLATWVIPALADTQGFLFDLVIDDQDVSQSWLKAGEVQAAITSHPGPLQGCDTISLGDLRYRATASPGYVARWFAEGVAAGTLARAPALTFSDKDRLQEIWVERHLGGGTARASFPSHRLASSQGFVDACLSGLGWGLNPEPLVAAHLKAGRLMEIAGDSPLDVALHWQFARATALAIAPLTRAIVAHGTRVLI